MSTWTEGEVLQLKKHGNAHARDVWLAKAPPVGTGGRPKEGDDINLFKRFVADVYEHKRYYVDAGSNGSAAVSNSNAKSVVEVQTNQPQQNGTFSTVTTNKWSSSSVATFADNTSRSNLTSSKNNSMQPSVPAQPPVDLLDFGAFDERPTGSTKDSGGDEDFFSASSVKNTNEVLDLFTAQSMTHTQTYPNPIAATADDEFGDFAHANPDPIAQAPSVAASFDPFNTGNDVLAPMKSTTTHAYQNQNISHSFDPFSNVQQTFTQNTNMMGNNVSYYNTGMSAVTNGTQNFDMFAQVNSATRGMQAPNPMNNYGYSQQSVYSTHQMNTNMHTSSGMTNLNIMQGNVNGHGNHISNNFTTQSSHGTKVAEEKKTDPFAGLGF